MGIRLGRIELKSLQRVLVDEGRKLVEHPLPSGTGSVFQDLGRGAFRLRLDGVLLGEESLRQIEELRAAQAKGSPLAFSADIAVGSDLTDVIVENFVVHQVPGYRFRYQFTLQLREWVEPPPPPGAALAAVGQGIAGDAAKWSASAVALGGALTEPGALADVLAGDSNLLSRLSLEELEKAATGNLGRQGRGGFGRLLAAVGRIDPGTLIQFVTRLSQVENVGDLFQLLRESGINLLEEAGIDLGELGDLGAIVQGFLGGPEFLDRLARVRRAAQALLDEIRDFDPLGELAELEQGPGA